MRLRGFRLRTLMIAVAVFAAVLAAWLESSRLARVAAARRRDAKSFAASQALALKFASQASQQALELSRTAESSRGKNPEWSHGMERLAATQQGAAEKYLRNAAHWAMMSEKYAAAARRPWRSMPPDPKPPLD